MYQCKAPDGTTTVRQSEKEFPTHWNSLVAAKRWVLGILGALGQADTLRYCIESTGTYHLPVLKAWAGIPSVVNPLLAGASHRKTDVLDARTLARHSITGLWKASFIPAEQAQVLRVLWARRREMARRATRAANQLNNIVLRFGFTFGADVSMRSIQGETTDNGLQPTDNGLQTTDPAAATTDPQHFPGAPAPESGSAKTYSLKPDLTFTKKGANRKDRSEQDTQNNQSSAAREQAEAQASARPSARRSGRPERTRARRASGTSNGGTE